MDWIIWLALVAVVVAVGVTYRRRNRIKEREQVRERLLSYRLEDMPHDEMKPLIQLAESVGLDWEELLVGRGQVAAAWRAKEEARRKTVRQQHEHLLQVEQEERQRQRAQEEEAIASIMAAMDDPHEIEAFKREHGL